MSPGPAVAANTSMSDKPTPARSRQASTTASTFWRCARAASSGTTPP